MQCFLISVVLRWNLDPKETGSKNLALSAKEVIYSKLLYKFDQDFLDRFWIHFIEKPVLKNIAYTDPTEELNIFLSID